ncbi:hypothetical protein MMC30_008715 [Trapelia coarctata]|nr:hypothetical protein [Trapelia coarctata]
MERSTSGGVPIVTERTVSNGVMMERTVSGGRPGLSVQNVQGHRRSGSLGVERRGSTTAKYGGDPRASNASWRSTRERIVIVDGNGTRREYYRSTAGDARLVGGRRTPIFRHSIVTSGIKFGLSFTGPTNDSNGSLAGAYEARIASPTGFSGHHSLRHEHGNSYIDIATSRIDFVPYVRDLSRLLIRPGRLRR